MNNNNLIEIGSRRELFVDDYLVDRTEGAVDFKLHEPQRREIGLSADKPWEGNATLYVTTLMANGRYRMYYRGWHLDLTKNDSESKLVSARQRICLAESDDGIEWRRVPIGRIDFEGSKENNIIWEGIGVEQIGITGFSPFVDTNPKCKENERFKAVGAQAQSSKGGLWPMASADGVEWRLINDDPVITDGKFDSQNLAFWDSSRNEYRAYIRDFRDYDDHFSHGIRDIKTTTSIDFQNWSDPVWLEYPGAADEQLYTNQIIPYYRAPHIFVGFPTRYVERPWSRAIEDLPELEHRRFRADCTERLGSALTDGQFMTSRDGKTFKRWGEAFLRPGPQLEGNWTYGDNYQSWGLIETPSDLPGAPAELSFFASEGYWRGSSSKLRRFSIRIDGFVSINASLAGGEVITRPLTFDGSDLSLNFAGSAAGSIRVEVQDAGGNPINGYRAEECREIIGDSLDRIVKWESGKSVGTLSGQPVRLRFVMKDCDIYSFQFKE
jgi:hypothetical protein